MTLHWPTIINIVIAAISGGFLTEAFRWMVGRKSGKISDAAKMADMAKTVVESYDQLVADLKQELAEQKKIVEDLQARVTQDQLDIHVLQNENEKLARQMEALHSDYQNLAEKYQEYKSKVINANGELSHD